MLACETAGSFIGDDERGEVMKIETLLAILAILLTICFNYYIYTFLFLFFKDRNKNLGMDQSWHQVLKLIGITSLIYAWFYSAFTLLLR